MKLSNTSKHLRIGMLAGIITLFMLIALIPDSAKEIVGWSVIVVWFCGTIVWEAWQWVKYGQKRSYWEFRGLDTICDLLAGNIPFMALTIIAMYGHYAGNVMRP